MRKIVYVISIILTILLIYLGRSFYIDKTFDPSIRLKETAIFSTETFITYSARGDYEKGRSYFLQLSVNVPVKDGYFTKKVLQEKKFKAKENTKILSDSILIEDIIKIISQNDDYAIKNPKTEWKSLDYTVELYNMKNGKIENGSGFTNKIR